MKGESSSGLGEGGVRIERREEKRKGEKKGAVKCGGKTWGKETGRREGDEEGEAGEGRWKGSESRVGAGTWRPQIWSPFLYQASAQQINTIQLGFFLFLIDIFESVLT